MLIQLLRVVFYELAYYITVRAVLATNMIYS